MAGKVLEANSPLISLGISVAPVTDWKLYGTFIIYLMIQDSVYTERYMKTPDMNADGYEKSAITQMDGFKTKPYLIIHGTADDNVM